MLGRLLLNIFLNDPFIFAENSDLSYYSYYVHGNMLYSSGDNL